MRPSSFLPLFYLAAPAVVSAQAPFQIQSGDRVLFMGDTLLEREGAAAALESRLLESAAGVPVTVRNLSFSADLPTGVSRASFDPAKTGKDRIREQLALVKPTVAVLGYGMAASLEEMTYASGDPCLNADAVRYGTEFTAAKFKEDLAGLMDAITAANDNKPVRFVLLAPLHHEDLRKKRPGLPDSARHNEILAGYTAAIRQLAAERGARFVDTPALVQAKGAQPLTDNGIHPTPAGLERWAQGVAVELGWAAKGKSVASNEPGALRKALQRKNELFFHRWRPANHTYIYGFRKREQGRNAVETEQFDALLAQADAAIEALRAGKPAPAEKVVPPDALGAEPVGKPDFQLGDGLEISLWAENPLLSKPVQMNWDAKGRLWVASTPIYPQIQPGAYATDRIFILEDSKHSGKADKVTVFADDLLIPTGVEPEIGPGKEQGAFVGASTELLHLKDNDGDGKADERRVVLSGFGTEDTHHTIHDMHWGVDGRLYFSQSIYIHSHMETPWGVVRLNSGGVLAYDPRTERVEVFAKGLVNTWGHQTNQEGQSFLTDGAGSNGLSWAFPGATFAPFEGSSATMPSVSRGGYPKFCGLEIVRSPLFPADWQGNAITSDFRAHRIVRFSIDDLEKSQPPRSAFATADQPDVVRTPDQSFRPIDLKFGPDGALYVADWTNPVINHGEVDFRDPRRDKKHGRIWRIVSKGAKALPWEALTKRSTVELLDGLLSPNLWEQEQSRRLLSQKLREGGMDKVAAWQERKGSPEAAREAAFARAAALGAEAALKQIKVLDPAGRAWEARWLGAAVSTPERRTRLAVLAQDPSPRVRLEAMRALSRVSDISSVDAVLKAAAAAPSEDRYYDFAAARSVRELSGIWTKAVLAGQWDWKGREEELAAGLRALDPGVAGPVLTFVMKDLALPSDGSGPWAGLIAHAGGVGEVEKLWALVRQEGAALPVVLSGLDALKAAALRGVIPRNDAGLVSAFLDHKQPGVVVAAVRLLGAWKRAEAAPRLGLFAADSDAALGSAAVEALAGIGGEPALKEAKVLLSADKPMAVRLKALAIVIKARPGDAPAQVLDLISASSTPDEALQVWRVVMTTDAGLAEKMGREMGAEMSPKAIKAGLDAARELGGRGRAVTTLFTALSKTGKAPEPATRSMQDWAKLVQERGNALKGERIYHGAAVNCVQCHAIGGAGGKLGPDMSTLGASAPLDYIVESVLEPAAKVKEGYHGVSYTLTDGGAVVGVPFDESSTVVRVRMPGGVETDVPKAKIKSNDIIGSLMPQGLVEGLSEEDKLNLFAFLGSVGRPGAFDASSGGVARAWKIVPGVDAAKNAALLPTAPAAFSLTDGRVLPEHFQTPLAMSPGSADVYAVTKLALGSAGRVHLEVEGAADFWINGEKVSGKSADRELAAGDHWVGVLVKRDALPEVLRATATAGRFVAP